MATNENVDVLDQEEEINIYDDVCDFDFGEEIEKLKAENKKLEEHICTLYGDIDKLNGTIAELKETQNNLTRNISALFVTAKGEIERKNRMIEELRAEVDNRQLSRFNPEIRKRKDRGNSPPEVSKPKKFKCDYNTAKDEEHMEENNKPNLKSEEKEPRSKSSDRYRQVDDNNKLPHRSKYPTDKYSEQFENNKCDNRFQHSNEVHTENNKFEFRNKCYNDRYNNYEDDGYHSRSTYYDRYRNDIEDRYDPRSQYLNDRYSNRTNNYSDRDEMYNNREYQSYNRNSRSNFRDMTLRERNEYRDEQGRHSQYTDNRFNDRCDSNYSRTERTTSLERPSSSRSGTRFTPFAPLGSESREDTSRKTQHDLSSDTTNSERRSVTPMPLAEDIEEPKPKPPKKRLKMLEEMEKKVKQNRLSQSNRLSDQNDGVSKKPPDINKSRLSSSYDSDRNSVISDKSDRESQRNGKGKESSAVKEKDAFKSKTDCRNEEIGTDNVNTCNKDIRQFEKAETTGNIGNKAIQDETESILKLIPNRNVDNETKELRQKSSKTAKTVKAQNTSNQNTVMIIEKDVKLSVTNETQRDTQKEVKSATKDSLEKPLHQNQFEDKNCGKLSWGMKKSPVKHLPSKKDRKSEEKMKKTKDQEDVANKIKDNTEKHTKHVNKNPKVITNEEMKSTLQPNEDQKENIGNDKGLRKDCVDNKEKPEQYTKVVKQKESSADIGLISKKSDQKNGTLEHTTKQDRNRSEKHKNIGKNKDKKQNQEDMKDSSKLDKPWDKLNKKSVIDENITNKNIKENTKESELDTVKQETTKEEKRKANSSRSKKEGKDDQYQDVQLENRSSAGESKEESKAKFMKNDSVKILNKHATKRGQSKPEDNTESTATDENRQNKDVVDKGIRKNTKESKEDTAKQEVAKEEKKNKSSSSKNIRKDDKKQDGQLTENEIKEDESKEESKDKFIEKDAVKNLNKYENKRGQSKSEPNIQSMEDVKRKRKKSTVAERNEDIRNSIENPEEHSPKQDDQLAENQVSEGESKEKSKDKSMEKDAGKNLNKNDNKRGQSKPEANIGSVEDVKRKRRKSVVGERDDSIKNKVKSPEEHSTEQDGQLTENQISEGEIKEESKDKSMDKDASKNLDKHENKREQSKPEAIESVDDVKRKRRKSTVIDQDENIKNKTENPKEHSTKQDGHLIENQISEGENKEESKDKSIEKDDVKNVNKNENKRRQSKPETNIESVENVNRKRRKSTVVEQDENIKNKTKNPKEHSIKQDSQLIENQISEGENKEESKDKSIEKDDVKNANKNENKRGQSKPETNTESVENVKRKRGKSTVVEQDENIKNRTKNPKEHSTKQDGQLIENRISESENKEESKDKSIEKDDIKNVNNIENKKGQSKPEVNIELVEDVKRKRGKSTVAERDDNVKNKVNNPEKHSTMQDCGVGQKNQNDTESSVGSKINQISKRKRPCSEEDLDMLIWADDEVTEQDTTKSSKEVLQNQPEKTSMKVIDDKLVNCNSTSEKISNTEKSEKIVKPNKTNPKTDDLDKIKPIISPSEQRNRINEAKRKLTFSKEEHKDILGQNSDKRLESQNVGSKINSKENRCGTSKRKKVVSTKDCKKVACVSSTEKEQETGTKNKTTAGEKDDNSIETITEEVLQIKNKTPNKHSPKEPPTRVLEKQSVSSSSSTDSESDSEESSNDVLSSVKSDNKLIEIKDIQHEKSRQIESIVSFSDSSTSDDTIVLSNDNDTKKIERKFHSLINNYIESLAKENLNDKPEKATSLDNSPTVDNTKMEVSNQDNCLSKEDVEVEKQEPKIKVLEVIKVNAQGKMEIDHSSTENPVPDGSKESKVEKSTVTPKPATQNTSLSPVRPTNRRITPTPVRDSKPLCSFENILTKTCPPETFVTTIQTEVSPLHLTDDGEIPVLHLEEHHINNLPTEVNINDKNIITLLDTMNISNIECEIPKFKTFSADTAVSSEVNEGGGSDCGLTFENKIEKTVSTFVNGQETVVSPSGVSNCASTATPSSGKVADSTKQVAVTPAIRRGRRRCWMVIKD